MVSLCLVSCGGEQKAAPPASRPTPAAAVSEAGAGMSDFARDGTPDFLRLDDQADRAAFVAWFTFLAEAQYFQPPEAAQKEIVDCAALIRFAYREALREHTGEWAAGLRLAGVPATPAVAKYRYPFTPLGGALFRVRPGAFRPADLSDGAFAQFADAQSLKRWNTHFVGRDLDRAQPGDLLFFEQLNQQLPFHAMIYLGPSRVEGGPENWIVYHTGPDGDEPGEIRRPSVTELRHHPQPRWRPLLGNGNFLGVYRWNILRDMS
ncbi:MAG: DUF1175 family protein [Bryobacteraceae bacterium]|nr:DUF1175 family protein [Bryobacteraceae bacterium]